MLHPPSFYTNYDIRIQIQRPILFSSMLLAVILLLTFPWTFPRPLSAESNSTLVTPFSPTGHFETNFLPLGSVTIGNANLIFLSRLTRSQNGGFTWQIMTRPITGSDILVVAPSPKIAEDNTLFSGSISGIHLSSDQGISWRYPQQPINKPISVIVVSPNFSTSRTLYAAGTSYNLIPHLYRSTDRGEHWQNRNLPPRNSEILQVILSPSDNTNQTLYIRFGDHSLWRTTNSGTTWNRVDNGLGTDNGNQVHHIGVAPFGPNGDILVVATQAGLVLSLDIGQTWYLLTTKVFTRLMIPPDLAHTLTFSGIHTGRLFRTTDLGATWINQLPAYGVSEIAISPHYLSDHTVVARNNDVLWVSSDRGANWVQRSGMIDANDYAGMDQIILSTNYENDGTLFVSTVVSASMGEARILRSTNFGLTWSAHELEGIGFIRIAVSPNFTNDQTVMAVLNEKLYRSTDGGLQWALVSSLPYTPVYEYSDIYLSPNYSNDHTIFVTHYLRGLYRSTNNGTTWTLLASAIPNAITDFAISPGYPGDPTLYLSVYNDGVYRSTNGGASWNLLTQPGYPTSRLIALSPAFVQDDTIFIAEKGNSAGGIYWSTDRGDNWTEITAPDLLGYTYSLAVSPRFAQDHTIVASGSGHIYISEDKGTTWFQLDQVTNSRELTFGYKNGFLQPVASNGDGIYFYQWPAEVRPPLSIGIPLDPNSTGPGSIPVTMPQSAYELRWAVTENVPWLTVNPATGPLTTPLVFTVDPTAVTIPASTTVNIGVYYSTNQVRFYNVITRAFYANHHTYLPIMER